MNDGTVAQWRLDSDDRASVIVRVEVEDGAWTTGPYISIEAGNELELQLRELAWLVEAVGPEALEELRIAVAAREGDRA